MKYSYGEMKKLRAALVESWRDWARSAWATKYVARDTAGDVSRISVVDSDGNTMRVWEAGGEGWDPDEAEAQADSYVEEQTDEACRDYADLWVDSDEAETHRQLSIIDDEHTDGDELDEAEAETVAEAKMLIGE